MEIIYWLIPVAVMLLAIAIAAFVWAVKSEQYSDLESPAYKILFDDDSEGNDTIVEPDKSSTSNEQPDSTKKDAESR